MISAEAIKVFLNSPGEKVLQPIISQEEVQAFCRSTQSNFSQGVPPTYVTKYRKGEFDWLSKFGVEIRQILHAEQQYEYLIPLHVGDAPEVETLFTGFKVRRSAARSLTFFVFESAVNVAGELRVKIRTSFVVTEKERGE